MREGYDTLMYERLKRLYLSQFLLYPITVFLVGVVSWKLFRTFVPAFVLASICLAGFLYLTLRLILRKCPHCGRFPGGGPSLFDKCDKCGDDKCGDRKR
jgi:hypothetical protein